MNAQRIFFKVPAILMPIVVIITVLTGTGCLLTGVNQSPPISYQKNEYPSTTENIAVPLPSQQEDVATISTSTPETHPENVQEYTGLIRHIFFHSLIIYPEKALADTKNIEGYKANMITVEQFKQILQQLYENNFVLIDAKLLYAFDENGNAQRSKVYVPKGKKPLILSVDDLSYYSYMKHGGFAHKLVVQDDRVKTEVLTPEGKIAITDDGDVVPIVDSFVKDHPDFSFNGAKGIIGVTGFQGILGYRTNMKSEQGDSERQQAEVVVEALKKSGWTFASHSFSHKQVFLHKTINANFLANDISRWAKEVEPLVGRTNIFIGPFGQVFSETDPRRKQLLDAGFTVLYGVGMDGYTRFFGNHFVMNRTDIDGYRLAHNAKKLYELFGIAVKADF